MPSFLPAPSYQDFSLQLAQGHWLPTSRWNAEDFQYFIEAKQHKLSQLLLPPKLYRHKRRVSSSLESNWILQGIEQQKPMGWAELQSFPGPNYRRGLLFFAIEPEAANDAMDLLTGLVSLAFTIGRFDQIMLLSLTEDSSVLDKLEQIIGSQGNDSIF
ncbi:MAG: hypothetical protein NTX25_12050 [Proteobacteria bacterium]|nr:hypothetical protein [Pseudomonadota bacterium]